MKKELSMKIIIQILSLSIFLVCSLTIEGYSENFIQRNEDTVKKFRQEDFNEVNLLNTLKDINQALLNGNEGLQTAILQKKLLREKDNLLSISYDLIQKKDEIINNLELSNKISKDEINLHKNRIKELTEELNKSNKKIVRKNAEIKILSFVAFIEGIVIFLKLKQ